ncbi:MAG: hypothetical protein OHK0021_05110 [Bryobacter sp.]
MMLLRVKFIAANLVVLLVLIASTGFILSKMQLQKNASGEIDMAGSQRTLGTANCEGRAGRCGGFAKTGPL